MGAQVASAGLVSGSAGSALGGAKNMGQLQQQKLPRLNQDNSGWNPERAGRGARGASAAPGLNNGQKQRAQLAGRKESQKAAGQDQE